MDELFFVDKQGGKDASSRSKLNHGKDDWLRLYSKQYTCHWLCCKSL
jgi:hypothetical protein